MEILYFIGIVLVVLGVLVLIGVLHLAAGFGALLAVGLILILVAWFFDGGRRRTRL